jgi:uncharacterized protein
VRSVLIVAHAARQLGAAAVAAGYRPIVADGFGDEDTRELAHDYYPLDPGGLDEQAAEVLSATMGGKDVPVIWGGGLEGCLGFLRRLADRALLLGSDLDGVAKLIDPVARAAYLGELQIPHPPQAYASRFESDWLVKTRGGAGGQHVQAYTPRTPLAAGQYLQKKIDGASYSLCFLATRYGVHPLGFNTHVNLQATSSAPYRYGGAIAGALLSPATKTTCVDYANALAAAFGLRGLCGFDFICEGSLAQVVDINPRPPATFDLLIDPAGAFAAHIAACRGEPLVPPTPHVPPRGHLVCYAPHPIHVPKSLNWPAWTADRPPRGAEIPTGAPVCSVYAEGAGRPAIEALLSSRLVALWQLLAA